VALGGIVIRERPANRYGYRYEEAVTEIFVTVEVEWERSG